MSDISPKAGSLSVIVRSYKSICTREIRRKIDQNFKWHSGYYERIIRSQEELDNVRRYIINNPIKWTSKK